MPSVGELKAQLKAIGRPTGGKKAELEARLASAPAPSSAAAATASAPAAAAAAPSAADIADDVALLSRAEVNKLLTLAAGKDGGVQEQVLALAAKRGGSRCRAQALTQEAPDWSDFTNTGLFGKLDKDTIVAIVSQLSFIDRLVLVRMVCRDFRAALLSDADLWSHLNLASDTSVKDRVRPGRVASIFKAIPPQLVKSLQMADLKLPVAVIRAMIPSFPQLEQLDLWEKGSSSVLITLGAHCPLIKRLGLQSAKINHSGLLELCEKLPLLERLSVEDTDIGSVSHYGQGNNQSSASFYRRLANSAPSLYHLSSHFTADALETLGTTMKLRTLVINQLPAGEIRIPQKLAPMAHLSTLVIREDCWSPGGSLGIQRSHRLDAWLALLLAAAPNLQELNIPGFDTQAMDRHSFLPDGLGGLVPNLMVLTLRHFSHGCSVRRLLSGPFPNLTTIQILTHSKAVARLVRTQYRNHRSF